VTFKYRVIDEGAAPTAGRAEQIRLSDSIWRSLDSFIQGESRPTEPEIQADKCDTSVPFSDWLARGSQRRRDP
jgi:hypothetical protein